MKRGAAVVVILLLIHDGVSAGQIFKWVDADGHVHYGDHPPPTGRTETVVPTVNTYSGAEVIRSSWVQPVEPDRPAPKMNVTMYSTSWCGVCRRARDYFQRNQVPFTEYDVEQSDKGKRDYQALQGRGVPIVLVGSMRMNGFTPDAFQSMYHPAALTAGTAAQSP